MHCTNTDYTCEVAGGLSVSASESQTRFPLFCNTATASVASGTTDDTGIESSSLGASPTNQGNPKTFPFRNFRIPGADEEQPPPVPPKTIRCNPPLPPKTFHDALNSPDVCFTARKLRATASIQPTPSSFPPPDSGVCKCDVDDTRLTNFNTSEYFKRTSDSEFRNRSLPVSPALSRLTDPHRDRHKFIAEDASRNRNQHWVVRPISSTGRSACSAPVAHIAVDSRAAVCCSSALLVNSSSEEIAKSGCGGLQWLSQAFSRFIKIGSGHRQSASSTTIYGTRTKKDDAEKPTFGESSNDGVSHVALGTFSEGTRLDMRENERVCSSPLIEKNTTTLSCDGIDRHSPHFFHAPTEEFTCSSPGPLSTMLQNVSPSQQSAVDKKSATRTGTRPRSRWKFGSGSRPKVSPGESGGHVHHFHHVHHVHHFYHHHHHPTHHPTTQPETITSCSCPMQLLDNPSVCDCLDWPTDPSSSICCPLSSTTTFCPSLLETCRSHGIPGRSHQTTPTNSLVPQNPTTFRAPSKPLGAHRHLTQQSAHLCCPPKQQQQPQQPQSTGTATTHRMSTERGAGSSTISRKSTHHLPLSKECPASSSWSPRLCTNARSSATLVNRPASTAGRESNEFGDSLASTNRRLPPPTSSSSSPSPSSASSSRALTTPPSSSTHRDDPGLAPNATTTTSSTLTSPTASQSGRLLPPGSQGPSTTTTTITADQHHSSFQQSLLELRKMGWYWGPLSFTEAEVLLAKRPDGTFLVRDSGHDIYILSLSFRVRGETYHTRIEHSQGRFSFWSQPQSHSASTVVEFIEKAVAHSISGQFHYFLQSSAQGQPPVEVPLLYPLSRFQIVPSLRHLTRFAILSCIRRDHIDQLPLPPSLLSYLMEKQCFVESLEAFEEAIRNQVPLEFRPRSTVADAAVAESVIRNSRGSPHPTDRHGNASVGVP